MKNELNNIGLIVADENEIQQMNEFLLIDEFNDKFKIKFYKYKNKNIYLAFSRIGLVNATIATQYLIDKFNVKSIWNYGAVGSIGNFDLHEVVIPKKFYFYDVITPWYKRGQIPGENEFYLNSLKEANENVSIASGNSFIDNIDYVNDLKKELDIDLIDMESCAIAQTCTKNKINFYCIKAISDVVGKNVNSKNEINKSIALASKKAFLKMIELLEKY